MNKPEYETRMSKLLKDAEWRAEKYHQFLCKMVNNLKQQGLDFCPINAKCKTQSEFCRECWLDIIEGIKGSTPGGATCPEV